MPLLAFTAQRTARNRSSTWTRFVACGGVDLCQVIGGHCYGTCRRHHRVDDVGLGAGRLFVTKGIGDFRGTDQRIDRVEQHVLRLPADRVKRQDKADRLLLAVHHARGRRIQQRRVAGGDRDVARRGDRRAVFDIGQCLRQHDVGHHDAGGGFAARDHAVVQGHDLRAFAGRDRDVAAVRGGHRGARHVGIHFGAHVVARHDAAQCGRAAGETDTQFTQDRLTDRGRDDVVLVQLLPQREVVVVLRTEVDQPVAAHVFVFGATFATTRVSVGHPYTLTEVNVAFARCRRVLVVDPAACSPGR